MPARRMARTTAMGLRREPQPPKPMVMPRRSSATMSSTVVRLSATGRHRGPSLESCRRRASRRRRPAARRPPRQVQLVGEALLEAVAALHVDRVDAVQRLLGPPDDGGALGRDRRRPPRRRRRRSSVARHHLAAPSRSGAARRPWPWWPCRPSAASCAGGRAGPGGWRRRARPGRPRAGRRWRRRRPR